MTLSRLQLDAGRTPPRGATRAPMWAGGHAARPTGPPSDLGLCGRQRRRMTMVMHQVTTGLTFTLVFLAGCTIKLGGDSDSDAASTSASAGTSEGVDTDATLGHSSAPTGDGPATTTTTTVDGTSTTTPTNATSDASDGSSGDVTPTACGLMCQNVVDCQLGQDPAGCTTLCEGNLAEVGPDCAAATLAALTCFASLSCEHLALALEGELGHPCGSEQIDRDTACGGGPISCDTGGGGNLDGSSCEVETQCPGDPLRRMECDTQQCVCLEDGVQVGSCPADDACKGLEEIEVKAMSCCGFTGPGI